MCKMHMFRWLKIMFGLLLAMGILLCCAGCKMGANNPSATPTDDASGPSSGMQLSEEDTEKLNSKVRIIAYFVSEDGKQLDGEIRYMALDEAKQRAAEAVETFIKFGFDKAKAKFF